MTTEAWVQPGTLAGNWRTVLFKQGTGGGMVYDLYANGTPSENRPTAELNIGGDKTVAGTAMLATGVWTHIAATYDGANLRFYVNGALVGTKAQTGAIPVSTGPLWIGNNTVYNEPYGGLIDEVRIYNRALSATEIQTDMNAPVGVQDTEPPTAPSNLSVTGSLTSGQLSWTGSTDNVGVAKYDVYRSTTAGFTPSAANRIAQPTGTTFTDTTAATNPGTYYYRVAAEDGNGNVSAPSNEANATIGDVSPPTAPGTLTATGAIGKATLAWGAASDNVGVARYDVYRSTTAGFTPTTGNRIAQPTGTTFTDTTTPGTYFYKVAAEDAAGNIGPVSNESSATITTDSQAPTVPAGVAANRLRQHGQPELDRVDGQRRRALATTSTARRRTASPPRRRTGSRSPPARATRTPGLGTGTYYYKVTAEDAAGNVSGAVESGDRRRRPCVAPTGLVAAYGFDEGIGGDDRRPVGQRQHRLARRTLVWSTTGKFGNALSLQRHQRTRQHQRQRVART